MFQSAKILHDCRPWESPQKKDGRSMDKVPKYAHQIKMKNFDRLLLCFTFLCTAVGSSDPCPPLHRNIIQGREGGKINSFGFYQLTRDSCLR